MIFAIPYIPGKDDDYKKLAEAIKRSGLSTGHVLHIVSEFEHEEEAQRFGDKVVDQFQRTTHAVLPVEPRGPLQRANDLFTHAARFLDAFKANEGEVQDPPMLYMDPRWRPSKNGWADTLQAEYYLRNRPKVTGEFTLLEDGSKNFQGPILFAPGFASQSGLIDYTPPDVFWRDYLRWELSVNGVSTELIGNSAKAVIKPGQPTK